MLKKKTPPWGSAQIEAIKQLKQIAQSPPPLKIPTTGQRILQIDASDDFWSAILLEKIGDLESYCAHGIIWRSVQAAILDNRSRHLAAGISSKVNHGPFESL